MISSQDRPSPVNFEHMASTHSEPPESSIKELQSALGDLLLARRTPHEPYVRKAPKWNGAFEILKFPREIRDTIYYHYLNRPDGVAYDQRALNLSYLDRSEAVTSLYLTCQQIYDEALQVFCRYNVISITGRSFHGTVRLFPDKPARLLQRVCKGYDDGQYEYLSWKGIYQSLTADQIFAQTLRDAYVYKSYFPKMREFIAIWYAFPHYLAQSGLLSEGVLGEEKHDVWYIWMKSCCVAKEIIPPVWVKFEFGGPNQDEDMRKDESALNRAYQRLVRETEGFGEERQLEESKRAWLKELDAEDRRSKSKRKMRRLERQK